METFRERVSREVEYIKQLFPEYTPHDEQYHLKRLFHVADTLLGPDLIDAMSSAELFILAISLYGHDWGMAVNDSEKNLITGGALHDIRKDDLWILPDEQERLHKFAREQRLSRASGSIMEDMPIDLWREYVRQTHAHRSAERVRRFFQHIDGGVADAAARICVGHWVDFEELEDRRLYPLDFALLREVVNLRAVTIYLRLIDLLDIGEDRTPYVIWKFVAPRNPRSRMEWAKHRALRPITCPSYLEGRIIRVEGSTNDHEVYSALEDLRKYCEEQFRRSQDLLARMNDQRHKLDLYHLDWRVLAQGFQPVSVQFEFDRTRMFEIISDEIYQGDPYVFLRELLQNSIDAINARREVLQHKGVSVSDVGVIWVNVTHHDNGDMAVTWRDDGIGMDEYVIRNYLAVVGKSYYRSEDFRRHGLTFDAISKFGVGILSCFMVADSIEIETYKDPYLSVPSRPLRIKIPAAERQFRVETRPEEGRSYGTTVRVFVTRRKLPVRMRTGTSVSLDVTSYLHAVAGFVEYPVVIADGSRKTIILHPKHDSDVARRRFGPEYEIRQLDLDYPWSVVIQAQDVPTAREVLREVKVDLSSDLLLHDCEGTLTYLTPLNDGIDCKYEGFGGGDSVQNPGKQRDQKLILRWTGYFSTRTDGLSRSGHRKLSHSVYSNGILIPQVSGRAFDTLREGEEWVIPRAVINIKQSQAPRLNLSRTEILTTEKRWDIPIWDAFLNYLSRSSTKKLLSLEPKERFYQFARLVAYHPVEKLGIANLATILPLDKWPVVLLDPGGKFRYVDWEEVRGDTIYLCPGIIRSIAAKLMSSDWVHDKQHDEVLLDWVGDPCLLTTYGESNRTLNAARRLTSYLLSSSHCWSFLRFLSKRSEQESEFAQEVWTLSGPPATLLDSAVLLERIASNPGSLHPRESEWLKEHYLPPGGSFKTVNFLPPYDRAFTFENILNFRHPATLALLQCIAGIEVARKRKTLTEIDTGRLHDAVHHFTEMLWEHKEPVKLTNALTVLFTLSRNAHLINFESLNSILPREPDFLQRSGSIFDLRIRGKPFGRAMT